MKTNEDIADVTNMMQFRAAVAGADEDHLDAAVAPFTSLESLAHHIGVARAIADDDGVMRFWCVGEGDECSNLENYMNHNYYWYDDPGGRFELIPWDMDTTFWDVYPPADLSLDWWAEPEICGPVPYSVFAGIEDPLPSELTPLIPPQCEPLIGGAVRLHRFAYLEGLQDAEIAMREGLDTIYEFKALIADDIAADPLAPMNYDNWVQQVDWLWENVDDQADYLKDVLTWY